jgi:hypothetical protein
MADALRRILYPSFVLTIIATLWAMGSAQAAADHAYNQTYWPALNPQLFRYSDERAPVQRSTDVVITLDDA